MDIYILDSLLRRTELIDRYLSCIWTERFNAYGDFELVLISTPAERKRFVNGTLLACNKSNYIMRVETVEDTTDAEGRPTLTITGPSLESLLLSRGAFANLNNTTTTPKWIITGTPGFIARKIVRDICITGILNAGDKIPFMVEGSYLPEDTIPEPIDPITVELEPMSVYQATKDICDAYSLGFRMLRRDATGQIYFDIYPGSDRTTKQNVLPAVLFTPQLDNLQNTKLLTSVDDYKNVAYVYSPAGFQMVYPADVNPEVEGFERHVLMINATDITSDNPNVTAALRQRGLEELAKHRSFTAFDGEIDPNSNYKYGVHYYLGDLIEVRNEDGATNDMRVTEEIFVSDEQGEREYPTLAVNLFIESGTWLAWAANQVWQDLGPTEYWATQ